MSDLSHLKYSMAFKIENIPLPRGRTAGMSHTMRSLNVGQSFLIPDTDLTPSTRKGLYTTASHVGISITTRTVDDGLRVWRVDPKIQNEAEIVMYTKKDVDAHGELKSDPLADFIAKAQAKKGIVPEPIEFFTDTVPVEDDWIEDDQTFENGEILYWHHKPKCKPVCYRRESDTNGA